MSDRKLIAVIGGILLAALVALAALWVFLPRGSTVQVTVDGKRYGTYSLRKDRTVVITAADGDWYNTLQIQNGQAAIIESNCSNQICVHTPALSEDTIGIIVCLPHGVVVELK